MTISIIIVTFNRRDKIIDALNALARQEQIENLEWEIIVVDHACTDGTAGDLKAWAEHSHVAMRVLQESATAVSAARNVAAARAQGEILAFTDDDCLPDPLWVRSIVDVFEKYECDAVGGRVLPVYPPRTPRWIKRHKRFLNGPIVFRDEGRDERPYTPAMLPFVGANMAVTRRIFDKVDGFDPIIGPGSAAPVGGEDTDVFWRISEEGRIIYSPRVSVRHQHDPRRMTLTYVSRWYLCHGYSIVKRQSGVILNSRRHFADVPLYLYKELLRRAARLLTDVWHEQTRLAAWCRVMWILGYCRGARELVSRHRK